MRKVVLVLVVSAVLTLPATAVPRRDPGSVMQRIAAFLRGGIVHVLDEIGLPKP